MTGIPIVHSFLPWRKRRLRRDRLPPQRDLHTHWRDQALVSRWAALSPPAFRLLDLLGPLHWAEFPERDLIRNWGQPTLPYAALAAAWLIQLNEGLVSMSLLRRYLVEHPLLKENNPKAYVSDRYDKAKQPVGDPDCRLGCKRRRNQSTGPRPTPPTPTTNPLPASSVPSITRTGPSRAARP